MRRLLLGSAATAGSDGLSRALAACRVDDDHGDQISSLVWRCVRVESYAQRHAAWLLTRLSQLGVAGWVRRLEFVPALARPVDGLYAEDGRPFKRAWAAFLRDNRGALRDFRSAQQPLVDVHWEAVMWRLVRSDCGRHLKTLGYRPYGEPVLAAQTAAAKARLALLTTGLPALENLWLGESVLGGWDAIEFVVAAWADRLQRLQLTEERAHFGPRIVGGLLAQTQHLRHLTLVNSLPALPGGGDGQDIHENSGVSSSHSSARDLQGDFPHGITLPTVRDLVIVHEHQPGLRARDIRRLLRTFPELRAFTLYTDVFAYYPDHDWTESNIMHDYALIREEIKLICRQSHVDLYWRDLRP